MPEFTFLIFWIFLLFFLEFSFPDRVWTKFGTKFFFFLFLGQSQPVLAKNNAEKGFCNFLNFFCYFFRNFLARVEYEQNSGLKFFFFLFLSLSYSVLAKNNAGMRFFNFLNFFSIFFGIFLPGSSMNGIWDSIFFFFFSAYLILFGLKIMPEWGFLVLWNFLQFFFRIF